MITLTQPSQTILMLTVPEDAEGVRQRTLETICWNYGIEGNGMDIDLPPGNWQLIGKGDALSEEEWRGIVESVMYATINEVAGYENYEDFGYTMKDTAKESGYSLLASHNLRPQTTVFLKLEK